MKTIAILAFDKLFDSSLTVTLDILTTARRIHRNFCGGTVQVKTLIYSINKDHLTTAHGLKIKVDVNINARQELDMVIVPGLGITNPTVLEEFLTSKTAEKAIGFLTTQHKSGAILTASCSATFLLAEAGLFDGQIATTSWWLSDTFRARYPNISLMTDRMLISGSGLICAGAAMAQADLMMAVVAQLYGEETARLTANYLLIDRRELQSQYIMSGLMTHRHPEVAKAESWIRENIAIDFTISDVAAVVGLSPRTLGRRITEIVGVGPLKFVQQLRIEHAIHLLETTHRSFETIAVDVGYQDASSLRRLLKRQTGKSPSQFRTSTV